MRIFSESEIDDLQKEREVEEKEVIKLIKRLKNEKFNNKDQRAEFAKIIFQLALSSVPKARKLISKLGDFISYWELDNFISEDEWRKLNNTSDLPKKSESFKIKQYEKYIFNEKITNK